MDKSAISPSGISVNEKKSWSELKGIVSDIRKRLATLSTMIPSNISFRTLPDGRTRIYFLSTPQNGWETTLHYADIPSTDEENLQRLNTNPVLEPTNLTLGKCFSREEQLLFERKRLATWGITSYELHRPSGKVVFPAASTLYHCLDTGFTVGPVFPSELRINASAAPLNPQICPHNSELVAYVSCGDIWVTHSLGGHTSRITHAHTGKSNLLDDPLIAGIPSYVVQEEFSRYQGYWWQPVSRDGVYRILYEEVDEREVNIFTIPSSISANGETEEFRFPRAGKANAKSKLKMVQFRLSDTLQVVDLKLKEMQCPLNFLFPWCEYIVRVGWTPDAQHVWAQIMDRRQQNLSLVLIHLRNFNCFLDPNGTGDHLRGCIEDIWRNSPQVTGDDVWRVQVICTESSRTWINVHDLLRFISITENEVQFLWASEASGFRHLYLITASIGIYSNNISDDDDILECFDFGPRIIKKVELTNGKWEVLKRSVFVDLEKQLVYFMGLRETPLEKHLYVVSLQKPGDVRLLTIPGFSYSVEFNKECTVMVKTCSSIQHLPSCQIFRIVHTCVNNTLDGIKLVSMGSLLEGGSPEEAQYCPAIFSPKLSCGETIYAMVFKPHNFQLGVKYPTVLNVYGGPEVQTVNNTFKGMRQLRMHMLAAQGYCVISIDSRGSQHRGTAFEGHLYCRMGTVELSDQVEVLQILSRDLGFIDLDRVAIHGWSYGGYLSLMGLIQYPEIFRLAIAGAPVTSWELYDTGYTERYMDLPENNSQGYHAGSILTYIHKFPDEENRLLIIHGMIDENVHFLHTNQLVNGLVRASKPYQLQVYPNERHSLRHLDASKHYETTLLAFLQNYL